MSNNLFLDKRVEPRRTTGEIVIQNFDSHWPIPDLAASYWGIRHQPLLPVLIALATGIVADHECNIPKTYSIGVTMLGLAAWMMVEFVFDVRRSGHHWFRAGFVLLSVAGVGSAWHHCYWSDYPEDEIGFIAPDNPMTCCIDLRLISDAQYAATRSHFGGDDRSTDQGLRSNMQTYFRAQALQIRDGHDWRPSTGNIELVIHDFCQSFRSGDRVRVFGRLVRPSTATNPGQFNYSIHCRRQRLRAMLHVYDVRSVNTLGRSRSMLTHIRSRLRSYLDSVLWRHVGATEAPFASAILLGNRRQLEKSRRDRFVETGTAHLLAISGLHVGILATAFLLLLRAPWIDRKRVLWGTIAFVLFYAWLVEFRPPVTRAVILIVLICWGRLLGSRGFSVNLLCAAAIIVLVINPTDLFSVGPQLSFLAVATLTIGQNWILGGGVIDPIQRLIRSTRPWPARWTNHFCRSCRTAFLVSAVIWVFATPLVANRFHVVAFSSALINPLLLVPIAMALYAGLATLVSGSVLPTPLANLCGYVCDRNLAAIEYAVGTVQGWSWSHCWVAGPSNFSVAVFYAGLALCVINPWTKTRRYALVGFMAAWLIAGWWLPNRLATLLVEPSLKCTFVDVGHGTSVLVQFPNGKNWLYDAGSLGAAEYAAANVSSVLWHDRVHTIDTLVVSHADADHFNAIPLLCQKFNIERVLISPSARHSSSVGFQALLQDFLQRGIPIETVDCHHRFSVGRADVSVLSPTSTGFGDNDNENSVVLQIDYQRYKVLLPGDIEKAGLEHLLSQPKTDFDLVMAAHHGSKNSQPAEFMRWSTPEWVAISGRGNRVSGESQLHDPTIANRRVLRTDQCGALRFNFPAGQLQAQHWSGNAWSTIDQPPQHRIAKTGHR